jgi:hypothetical protein
MAILRLVNLKCQWTASSDHDAPAARCRRPAAKPRPGPLGNCSSCDVLPANLKVKVGGEEMETESHGCGGTEDKGPGGAPAATGRRRRQARRPAETRGGDGGLSSMARDRCPVGLRRRRSLSRRRRKVKRYGQGPPAARGRRRGLRRGGRGVGEEPSGATSVRRGEGGTKRRSQRSRGVTDTGGAEHTRGKRPCHGPGPNVHQQRRGPGKEVANGRDPAAR